MSESEHSSESEPSSVESLMDLKGAYWYEGDGDWARITGFDGMNDDELVIKTESIRYECVPHEIRDKAYDAYDGSKRVIAPEQEAGA